MPVKIAVTGGIAEGKSTVVGYLRDAGLETESSDEIARKVFSDPEVQSQLGNALGRTGNLSSQELRDAIAADEGVRRQVNRITHPRILAAIDASSAQVFEVPLLIETCLQSRFQRIWVATCGPEEQLRRLTERLGNMDAAKALIATQLPTSIKLAFADTIVRTNIPPEDVNDFVVKQLGENWRTS